MGVEGIRQSINGADRAFPVIEGGKGGRPPAPPPGDSAEERCRVTAIGHIDGRFVFLDCIGQRRELSAKALGSRHDLVSLFLGDEAWLRREFPRKANVKRSQPDGTETTEEVTVDFVINKASAHFQQRCRDAGIWGDHITLRRPGVWPDTTASPAVHCGDQVLIGGTWLDAGHRSRDVIWSAAAATPRPGLPCDKSIGEQLKDDIQRLFRFREVGGAIAAVGLLGTAYYGGAAEWRSAGFLLGPAGCGKSTLLRVLAACCPMNSFTNDTSKAGLEQAIDGRSMPVFIDENEKLGDEHAAQTLLDLVLTASAGIGTKGLRGGIDGRVRKIEMVASIMMAATAAPEMRETHMGRFCMIEMLKPEEGADFRAEHAQLVARMAGLGAQLWGRALAAFERYNASLTAFRDALGVAGCAPRERDQLGAILAGWWVLTREGVPDGRGTLEGVGALAGLVRTAEIVEQDSNTRNLVRYIMGFAIQLDRSTAREPIANLIDIVLKQDRSLMVPAESRLALSTAKSVLETHGIRPIREREPNSSKNQPAPRMAEGDGVWFATKNPQLQRIFGDSQWEGTRWLAALRDLPSAKMSPSGVRFGSAVSRAVWVSAADLDLVDESTWETGPPTG